MYFSKTSSFRPNQSQLDRFWLVNRFIRWTGLVTSSGFKNTSLNLEGVEPSCSTHRDQLIPSLFLFIWLVDSFQHPFHPFIGSLSCQNTKEMNLNSISLHHGTHVPQESGIFCIAIVLWKELFRGVIRWNRALSGMY